MNRGHPLRVDHIKKNEILSLAVGSPNVKLKAICESLQMVCNGEWLIRLNYKKYRSGLRILFNLISRQILGYLHIFAEIITCLEISDHLCLNI